MTSAWHPRAQPFHDGPSLLRLEPMPDGFQAVFPLGPAQLRFLHGGDRLLLARTAYDSHSRQGWTEVSAWQRPSSKPLWSFSLRNDLCCSPPAVDISGTGEAVVAGNGVALLGAGGQLISYLPLQEGEYAYQAALSGDGRWLAATTSLGRVLLWDASARLRWSRHLPDQAVGLDLSSSGALLTVATNTSLELISLPQPESVARHELEFDGSLVQVGLLGPDLVAVVGYARGQPRLELWRPGRGQVASLELPGYRLPVLRTFPERGYVSVQDLLGAGWVAVGRRGQQLGVAKSPGGSWVAGAWLEGGPVVAQGGRLHGQGELASLEARAPGIVQVVEAGERWVAALGSSGGQTPIPDRLWLWPLSRDDG